ncbi:type II toxin-antitoxin system PemK/MazF family toxin [Clostridium perfringens]|uniref:type II toxin-antitoxin system PemK/MazF family toxin n=1 Tax=Clostridium perfringens TaxID=1502 RepID=UPI001CCA3732|nr:type II toxin-antitoxin system PemK/MazF family toxin [Clostridium perfringens]MDM0944459.1 type II toxin-antitoxin system PemK/MazF family toxin [Clostridium perfringens]UBK33314.1 PemK family transcriptional regulator [Clostridium perfringens]UBL03740.1 PemK family transcriptional regulator [Clostridium perfringens]
MNGTERGMTIKPQQKEVWVAKFPFEENNSQYKIRPVIILGTTLTDDEVEVLDIEEELEEKYLSTKITTHECRQNDKFDTIIVKWREANLNRESIARVSKTIVLERSQLLRKIGDADESDFFNILERYIEYLEEFN